RTHLILLGRGEQAPPITPTSEQVSPTVKRLIKNLGPNPAFVLGRRWDIICWNRAYSAVFGDPGDIPKPFRNHVWLTFTDPGRRALMPDWEKAARLQVARFRADCAENIGDPAFDELIAALHEVSPEFCRWWKRHEVAVSGSGRKTIKHPVEGQLAFEHAIFRPADTPEQRLALFSPLPDHDTPAKLARLCATSDYLRARFRQAVLGVGACRLGVVHDESCDVGQSPDLAARAPERVIPGSRPPRR